MPHMNGRQLVEEIQRHHPKLPLLVMSAYSDDDIEQRGLSLGDTPFISKPFTLEGLASAVRNGLDREGSGAAG